MSNFLNKIQQGANSISNSIANGTKDVGNFFARAAKSPSNIKELQGFVTEMAEQMDANALAIARNARDVVKLNGRVTQLEVNLEKFKTGLPQEILKGLEPMTKEVMALIKEVKALKTPPVSVQ